MDSTVANLAFEKIETEALGLVVLPVPHVERLSWPFRWATFAKRQFSHLIGMVSVIFLLAVAANIPIIQLLSFGYLLEVMGRLARRQPIADAMIGFKKAAVIGSMVLGSWLLLWPIRLVSNLWLEAYLIDPDSPPTRFLRVLQLVMIALVIVNIGAACICGGKLRYFLWPLVAPISFAVWCLRRMVGWKFVNEFLTLITDWFSPRLARDIANTPPIVDWFLPAIFIRKLLQKDIFTSTRDAVWEFFCSLNLQYYFMLGLKGFLGSFMWLLIPSALLAAATYSKGGIAVLVGVFGVLIATPVFAMLPFLQAHFAVDGRMRRFFEVKLVWQNFGRAPVAHSVALLLVLVLALPLFFLKIETIPSELLWTLSVVFLVFTWPAKWVTGWAYRQGTVAKRSRRWWVRYPAATLMMPVAFSFAVILTLTRYVSWNGALSVFENHVFLLPAPFWQ